MVINYEPPWPTRTHSIIALTLRCIFLASAFAEEPQSLGVIGVADQEGIRVTEIIPGGPAETAGLTIGDILTTIDEKPVKKISEKSELMASKKAGSQLVVTYVRGEILKIIHLRETAKPRILLLTPALLLL
jgi:S1-C subfamily serine protease